MTNVMYLDKNHKQLGIAFTSTKDPYQAPRCLHKLWPTTPPKPNFAAVHELCNNSKNPVVCVYKNYQNN